MKAHVHLYTAVMAIAGTGCKPAQDSPGTAAASTAAPATTTTTDATPTPEALPPPKAEPAPPAAPTAPAAVNGFTATLTDMPADQPWRVELVPLEKLKILKEDRAWQWATPELKAVDLSKEDGKAGLLLHYRKTGDGAKNFLAAPSLGGKEPLATGHDSKLGVMSVTSNATGKLKGYMLGADTLTFTFIWLVEIREASLPLITDESKAAPVSPQSTVKISSVVPAK